MAKMLHRPQRPARPRFRRARATLVLLGITWVLFFIMQLVPQSIRENMAQALALSPNGLQRGWFWQVITHLFVHDGFWHLLVNSALLYFAGRALERTIGIRRFLIVFFLGGLFGAAVEHLAALDAGARTTLIMGNSAATCAVLLTLAILRPRSEGLLLFFVIPIRIQTALFAGVILVSSLVLAIVTPASGVGNLGHFAGACCGLMLGFLMRSSRRQEVLSRGSRLERSQTAHERVVRSRAITPRSPEHVQSHEG